MNIYPIAVRVRKAGAFEVLIEVPPIAGEPSDVARKLRMQGANARVRNGEVIVEAT